MLLSTFLVSVTALRYDELQQQLLRTEIFTKFKSLMGSSCIPDMNSLVNSANVEDSYEVMSILSNLKYVDQSSKPTFNDLIVERVQSGLKEVGLIDENALTNPSDLPEENTHLSKRSPRSNAIVKFTVLLISGLIFLTASGVCIWQTVEFKRNYNDVDYRSCKQYDFNLKKEIECEYSANGRKKMQFQALIAADVLFFIFGAVSSLFSLNYLGDALGDRRVFRDIELGNRK